MSQLWLVPVDEPSFQATLDTPIDLRDQVEKPATFPDYTRVWGVRTDPEQGGWERNTRNLARMEPGNPLVIYRNETSQYHATGRVGPFWHTEYVRDEYWNGGPALDVFAVEGYTVIDVSREEVNETLGYESDFWPQGLWRVAEDRPTERLVRKLDF